MKIREKKGGKVVLSNTIKYSVLIPLYWGEKDAYLKESLGSMIAQTYPPDEIVIVKDGSLTKELEHVLEEYDKSCPGLFHFTALPENQGLGAALMQGILHCKNEWVARMDADDVALKDRCQLQLEALKRQPELDMICSNYYEFEGDMTNKVLRKSPETHDDILKFARRRNPFGHCCMMYRKSKVLEAGNYNKAFSGVEDYDLWVRMFQKGCRCYNIQRPLVYVRGNGDFYGRRGGNAYWKKIMLFFRVYYKQGFFTPIDILLSCGARTIVYFLPVGVRIWIYRRLLRKRQDWG